MLAQAYKVLLIPLQLASVPIYGALCGRVLQCCYVVLLVDVSRINCYQCRNDVPLATER